MLNVLFLIFVSFMQGFAAEQNYAPNFSLPILNTKNILKRYGLEELRLSNFVGEKADAGVSSVIIIMADAKTFDKDLKILKKIHPKAAQKKIEFLVLYSSKGLNFQQQVEDLNIPFPVMNDAFEVVRGRYAYIQPQYCYAINWERRIQKDICSGISDVEKLLK